jgi:hypothetical protein
MGITTNVNTVWRHLNEKYYVLLSRAGIATGYGLDDREIGVPVPVVSRIFSSPRNPDRL